MPQTDGRTRQEDGIPPDAAITIDKRKLYDIFDRRFDSLWRTARVWIVPPIEAKKMWRDKIISLGFDLGQEESSSDSVWISNPISKYLIKSEPFIKIEKDEALRILVLGELP